MDVLQAIRTKHAVRQFSDQPVPDEVIRKILDSGRRSQSSKNTQPWQFVVVRERAQLVALSKTGTYAGHLAGAAFAVVLVGDAQAISVSFDLGQASSYLQLAAWELGVGSCIATLQPRGGGQSCARHSGGAVCAMVALSFGYPADDSDAEQGRTLVARRGGALGEVVKKTNRSRT